MDMPQIQSLIDAARKLPEEAKMSALADLAAGLKDLASEEPGDALRAHAQLLHAVLEIGDADLKNEALETVVGTLRDFPEHHILKGWKTSAPLSSNSAGAKRRKEWRLLPSAIWWRGRPRLRRNWPRLCSKTRSPHSK